MSGTLEDAGSVPVWNVQSGIRLPYCAAAKTMRALQNGTGVVVTCLLPLQPLPRIDSIWAGTSSCRMAIATGLDCLELKPSSIDTESHADILLKRSGSLCILVSAKIECQPNARGRVSLSVDAKMAYFHQPHYLSSGFLDRLVPAVAKKGTSGLPE